MRYFCNISYILMSYIDIIDRSENAILYNKASIIHLIGGKKVWELYSIFNYQHL